MQSKTQPLERPEKPTFATTIPGATYRIQFNKEFTFLDALEIVPYLADFGITHIYASPFFKARPGSMHGYDIIDHQTMNPEIGSSDEFNELIALLKSKGMGLIVDFVPNHMGIGSDNPWWMDVLENGPASAYVDYFDVDWAPVKKELFGKVLIPILGESYGKILENGEFKLAFCSETGKVTLNYYDHHLPLDPVSYPTVLGHCLDALKEKVGANNEDVLEYMSILSAFERLPNHIEPVGFGQRIGEKVVQMSRLARLCRKNSEIASFVQKCVESFNVEEGDPASMQRLHDLLEAQPYRLAYWRVASDEINYRRFFDINDLAAIRTEDLRVFNEIHSLVFDMVAEKMIDGIRIDHPDGLFDPETYFRRLQQVSADRLGVEFRPQNTTGGALQRTLPIYVVAEKILAPFEQLEDSWLVHGTTGYDFMDTLNNLLVAEENEAAFNTLYEEFIGYKINFEEMKWDCKGLILDNVLSSELNVLTHRLSRIAERSWFFRDFTLSSLRNALRNIVVHFPVYRTYTSGSVVPDSAKQFVDWAVKLAKRHSGVPHPVYDFVAGVLKGELDPDAFGLNEAEDVFGLRETMLDFAMRFQQFTGPVTAKSIEDTMFYRYNRLLCLNEVGSEPKRFGTSAAAFHRQNVLRQEKHPYGMLGTSTHDTKRSEDVRARIAVLSEIPEMWRRRVQQWAKLNERHKNVVDEEAIPDRNDEYLIYQNILGCFPHDDRSAASIENFKERIKQYAMKAIKEAKVHTSWIVPNEAYERGFQEFIDRILTPGPDNVFLKDLEQFVDQLAMFGFANALTQTALKLTSPGVPDFYQGNELWDFSLVDPDNRRPVDFTKRISTLNRVQDALPRALDGTRSAPAVREVCNWSDGSLKMYLSTALLRYRRLYPELFTAGSYVPLEASGEHASNVLAFCREYEGQTAIIVVPLKLAALIGLDHKPEEFKSDDFMALLSSPQIWGDTKLALPPELEQSQFANLLTNESLEFGSSIDIPNLFTQLPLAILVSPGK